jgi:hypothetical protein
MEESIKEYEVVAIPSSIRMTSFAEAMLGSPFSIYYNSKTLKTILFAVPSAVSRACSAMPGLELQESNERIWFAKPVYIVGYPIDKKQDADAENTPPLFADIYSMLNSSESAVAIFSFAANKEYIKRFKSRLEDSLSVYETHTTKSEGGKSATSMLTKSSHSDVYYNSEERKVFLSMLAMLDESALVNWNAYNTFIVCDEDSDAMQYLKSKILFIEYKKIKPGYILDIFSELRKYDSLPLNISKLSELIFFGGRAYKEITLHAQEPLQNGIGVEMGSFLRESVMITESKINLNINVINLGIIISGLPGSGKTYAAMSLTSQVHEISENNTKIIVISPTAEWAVFAENENIPVIKLYDKTPQINFFGCYSNIKIEKFYENLAMLLASSSNSGPYKNSMEKCLLSAFHKAYASERCPDPTDIYYAIEDAVISQHGKRTNTGIRYTKHGENVMSALENLRLMLSRPEFSYKNGINFKEMTSQGVVFDLSNVSNSMKPFFYSLILNQVYSLADEVDELGDKDLRMLICLEEAQSIFGQDETSGATLDLKQRMQDFRKKGIGIMLLAHNVTDIYSSIRRLCQIKMYFRQSSDMSKYAVSDLGFDEEIADKAVTKLKMLNQRVCALSYMSEFNGLKKAVNPIFIHTSDYDMHKKQLMEIKTDQCISSDSKEYMQMHLNIINNLKEPVSNANMEISYLGETLWKGDTGQNGKSIINNILKGKRYDIIIKSADSSKKTKFKISIIAEEYLTINI